MTSELTRIRILQVISALSTGGAETMLLKLLSATRETYCQAVISGKDEGTIGFRIKKLGMEVHTLKIHPAAPNPFRLLKLKSLVREFRPHIIQGWMYHGNLLASLANAFAPKRSMLLWNIRQSLEDIAPYKWQTAGIIKLGALLSRYPAAIIYNSRSGEKHHRLFGFHNTKQIVIPNGFDCDVFRPNENARRQIRMELGIARDTVLIGLIARYDPIKDHCGFLQAAALVARTHRNVRFALAGRGVSAEQPVLRDRIASEGLQEKVFLLGERFDIERVTCALDIACSASWAEGFSNAIGEAMACGVPCVVTDVGDSAFLVSDTGRAAAPRNPVALAAAIGELIDAGFDCRRQLGIAARRRIESEFSLPLIGRRYQELYQSLLPP